MIQKYKNHPYPKHFAAYCASHLLYGLIRSGLGPLIPFLSEKSGIIQTEYSFFFSCRSFGMLAGAILLKLGQNLSICIHRQIVFSSCFIFLTSWLFSQTESISGQGVWMAISAMLYSIFQIHLNVCILLTNKKQDVQFWMLFANGLFGIGGLMGPLIVFIFGTDSFTIIGLLFLLLIPAYYLLPSPELQISDFQNSENLDTTASIQRSTPRKAELLLCISMFTYIGLECTYGGWISSFSILAGVSSKQNATIYPSIFWLFATIFRFVLAFIPGTANEKMEKQIQIAMGCGAFCLALIHMGYTQMACYVSAIIFGAALSSIYALVLTISTLYGFTLADYQTGNIVTFGILGEGFLTMSVGILMENIHINMLFYGMIIMAFAMEILRRLFIRQFEQAQRKVTEKSVQLTEKFLKN